MSFLQKSFFVLSSALCLASTSQAQNVISHWNFNSVPPDASTSTGTLIPAIGSGVITALGGVTTSFSSGANADSAISDNSGLGLSGFPTLNANNKSAGVQINLATLGLENIRLAFELRSSNTGSGNALVQYCLDITASNPVWVDMDSFVASGGDVWINRSVNFSAISGLNNNTNAGFRVVSKFANNTNAYAAARATSTYAPTGTWRFDMVSIYADSINVVVPQIAGIELIQNTITLSETDTAIQVVARLLDDIDSTVRASLVFDTAFSTITQADIQWPLNATFEWAPNSAQLTDTIVIPIHNDALKENDEYLVATLTNLENASITQHVFTAFVLDDDKIAPVAAKPDFLKHITSFSNGVMEESSAEIIAFDPASKKLFIANSIAGKVDIFNFANPEQPVKLDSILIYPTYGNINSIAVKNGIVAAAVENTNPQDSGFVVFFDTNGAYLSKVTVGAMPDMITFNASGTKVLTANEGEPSKDYSIDPEGSISIITLPNNIATINNNAVKFITFESFNPYKDSFNANGIRVFGPNASVAQDLEPEYISISPDGKTAFVTLQENNAIASIDLEQDTLIGIYPLGTKDHSLVGNALDVSDRTDSIILANYPIKGVLMPDAIASFQVAGQNYYITANEGDAREYDTYAEVVRLSHNSYQLDTMVFPQSAWLKDKLGRINVTKASGDLNQDGYFEEIHIFGGRSFSIFNGNTHQLVYDNGQDFELITSQDPKYKAIFNASNSNNTFKNRSDDKGPEPEGVSTAVIDEKTYAFIALERIGGVMVYDVSNPVQPIFVDYKNNRETAALGGDLGAEGIIYIAAQDAPNKKPYVLVANEVSSTVSVYEVQPPVKPNSTKELDKQNIGFIYPNPGTDLFHIVLAQEIVDGSIQILSTDGKIIHNQVISGKQQVVSSNKWPNGTYLVQIIKSQNITQTLRFVKH